MPEADLAAAVTNVLAIDPAEFQERVDADAQVIKEELRAGTFDNSQAIVGLEYEFYAVGMSNGDPWTVGDDATGTLRRVPRRLLELIGFEKELGLHNAEMTVSPQPLNSHGLSAQEAEVSARLSAAQDRTRAEGMQLVSDGMWTIPPEGESARSYLTDSVDDSGVQIATNMSDSVRYHAMANTEAAEDIGLRIDAPHVSLQGDTVMPESLITSIQPHYQVPQAIDLPEYFRYALRIAGPLVALGVNSPFFPPDLYDADATAEEILADGWMEHRIDVFETAMNAPDAGRSEGKVKFPRDLEHVEQAVNRIVRDDTLVPMPVEAGSRFDDEFAHFRRKHGTYWRWIRPVFGGATRSAANARIEFRPLPAQPTVSDAIAFQAAFAGLLESLPQVEHPVANLPWEDARENFYAAMREGLDADLQWITNAGEETTDRTDLYKDLLAHAADGLERRGFTDTEVEEYLWPLRQRARHELTPARWKRRMVRRRLDDGDSFEEAVYGMQRRYFERQRDSLIGGSFTDWVDDRE
jgi:hypothetical protein